MPPEITLTLEDVDQYLAWKHDQVEVLNLFWGTGFSGEKPATDPISQQSVFSDNLRASSSSTPRYRIVLSSFECPSKICTALMFFVLA